MTRVIKNIIDDLIYYSVRTGKEEEDGCYVLSKRHMEQFLNEYCD